MRKTEYILLTIIAVIFLGAGCQKDVKPEEATGTIPVVDDTSNKVTENQSNGVTFWQGEVILTGYVKYQDELVCDLDQCYPEKPKNKIANFIYFPSNNEGFNNYANFFGNGGNIMINSSTVRLGCLIGSGNNKIIRYTNCSGSICSEYSITGNDLKQINGSSINKPIKLQMILPPPDDGRDAPPCYSHFRDFNVIEN